MTDHEPPTATMPPMPPPPTPAAGLPAYPTPQSWGHPAYSRLPPVKQTTAVWALVLAVVPIPVGWLVSIGLAISVLAQSRDGRGRERGRGMAIAALVIAPLWIVAVIASVAIYVAAEPQRDATGNVTASGDAPVTSLRTGDCLGQLPQTGRGARTIKIVPCSGRHVARVFAEFELQKGAYPGDDNVARLAEGGCVRRFDDMFPGSTERERSRLFYYHPLASGWSRSRSVTCIVATVGSDA